MGVIGILPEVHGTCHVIVDPENVNIFDVALVSFNLCTDMHNVAFFAFVIMDDSLGGISKSAVPVNPQRRRWNHEGGNTEGLRKVWGRISRQGLKNKSQHMFNSAYKFK